MLDAHPTMSCRCCSSNSRQNGCWRRKRSSDSMSSLSSCVSLISFADRVYFFGDVDRHRTPRDAASAAGASRRAELVEPGGELVRHPLAIARLGGGANAAAVDIRVLHGETGVPLLDALGGRARQIGVVFHSGAEARGTYERAVGAVEAACGDVLPARMLVIGVQELLDSGGVHGAAHVGGGAGDHVSGGGVLGLFRRRQGKLAQNLVPDR